MKKKIIILLICLMSFAMLGIILIQIFWIRNAVMVNTQQFNRSVNDALNDVVNNIEKKETFELLGNNIPDLSDSAKSFKTIIKADSINVKKNHEHQDSYEGHMESNVSISITDDDNTGKVISYTIEGDSADYSGNSEIRNISLNADSLKLYVKEVIGDKSKKINIILGEIMHELEFKDVDTRKRIKLRTVEEILNKALTKRNITTDYSYFVEPSDSVPIPDSFNQQEAYSISLFSDDLFKNTTTLYLYFPDKNNFILSRLSLLLIGSLVFTLCILLVFIISIRTILRQKKLSEIKSDFINNMTHEFKTPIATISLATDSIENSKVLNSPEQILYFTKVIREENQRMNNQVENVLQIALTEKKELELDMNDIDIHTLIEKAIDNIRLKLEQKNGKIFTDLKAEQHIGKVDSTHFINVIYNLLDNACKYSDQSPEIIIASRIEEDEIVITVTDKGIGMTKEVQTKVFEKFYRGSTGNIHNIKGHGLGLSYAKAIIEHFGGTIQVSSEPGKGSTFIIRLKLSHEL